MECAVAADKTGQTPLWDCPCRECWKLEQDLNDMLDIPKEKYSEWKADRTEVPHD